MFLTLFKINLIPLHQFQFNWDLQLLTINFWPHNRLWGGDSRNSCSVEAYIVYVTSILCLKKKLECQIPTKSTSSSCLQVLLATPRHLRSSDSGRASSLGVIRFFCLNINKNKNGGHKVALWLFILHLLYICLLPTFYQEGKRQQRGAEDFVLAPMRETRIFFISNDTHFQWIFFLIIE